MAPIAAKGTDSEHDQRFRQRTEVEIKQQENDPNGDGDDQREPFFGPHQMLVLTGPDQPVAGRVMSLVSRTTRWASST